MKRIFLFLVLFLFCGASYGLSTGDLGSEITIWDGLQDSQWGGVSPAQGIAGEDNETEGNPNTLTYQGWDLEGMFWNSSTEKLFIIGGFNYLAGGPNRSDINMGDIFIGTNYVLDLSRSNETGHLTESGTYNIVRDYKNTIIPTDVKDSGPYAYSYTAGDNTIENIAFTYSAYQINSEDWANMDIFLPWQTGAYGKNPSDIHYALEINLTGNAELVNSGSLIHATLKCGNDLVTGKAAPVPEPATMLLLGAGLVGLAGFGRKRLLK